MKKFTFLLTSFLLLLFGNACKNQDKNAFIKGKLHGTKAKVVYLEKVTPQGNELVDSASIKSDGSFTMLKKPDAKGYYILRIGKVRVFNTANLPPHAILLISDPTEKIELEAHGPDFKKNYTIKGSEETALMKEVSDYIDKIALTLDSLRPEVAITNGMTIDGLQAAQKAEAQNRVAWVKKFVTDHAGKLVTIQALSLINLEENFSLAEQVVQGLKDKFPDDPYIMNLRANLAYMSPFVIGALAPDFTISTPTGNPISLKDFRGKYVLVDFWASWCRPCRAVNPALVEVYNQFKTKNFTVFGVSLDAKKEDWLKAIKDDKLTWEHGSDLAYWNSAPAKLYRVTGIPYSVLLDPEGKIIAKNLHPDQLGDLLTQVFEKQ